MKKKTTLALAVIALAATVSIAAEQQGVTKTEILVGSIQDLSGPLAGYGKQLRNGMQLRAEEANEQAAFTVAGSNWWWRMMATTPKSRYLRRKSW
jgi:branched-chain amino acid transport system substrate-binding protein